MPSSSTISVKAFIVAALLLSEVYAKCFFNAVTFTSFFHPGAWLLLAECYCFQTWCSNCTSLLVMGLCQQWVPHIWTPSLSPFCQGLNCALCNTGLRPFVGEEESRRSPVDPLIEILSSIAFKWHTLLSWDIFFSCFLLASISLCSFPLQWALTSPVITTSLLLPGLARKGSEGGGGSSCAAKAVWGICHC